MSQIFNLDKKSAQACFHALASRNRLAIYELLREKELSISQIAREMHISQSFATKEINILEKATLVQCGSSAGIRGAQKICRSVYDEIVYRPSRLKAISDGNMTNKLSIPIGAYQRFEVFPTCGLVNEHKLIGFRDDPQSFYDPAHTSAQLLWFARGWLEYHLPRKHPRNAVVEEMRVAVEISSENAKSVGENECPSDISLWVNGEKIGPWHSWGFYTNTRGRYTPAWWPIDHNQFGLLKEWKINGEGAYVDGEKISSVTISDLALNSKTLITLRLGIDEQDEHQGGVCLFGRHFGNYSQDMLVTISYKGRRQSHGKTS
ncbi:MAG: helix-turn-helix domain-containing protein [Kiritimatiellae bacterium]|nr:helix-turn-helix domain-containing protein [Kiritimatiellia bacterium]